MTEENEAEEKKEDPKPVNLKQSVLLLVDALKKANSIDRYQVKEKNYPSDLKLMVKGGPVMQSPTLVRYLALAETQVLEANRKQVIEKAAELIKKDIEEIRGILKL